MKKILNVGHCNSDGPKMKQLFESSLEDTQVVEAKTHNDALTKIKEEGPWDIILVNRIFDVDGYEGLTFISEVKKENPAQKILLISNFKESQKDAEEKGALEGFGKNDLDSGLAVDVLTDHLSEKRDVSTS